MLCFIYPLRQLLLLIKPDPSQTNWCKRNSDFSDTTLSSLLSDTYFQLLKLKHQSSEIYKRVLVNLHQTIIPHLSSPLLLSDFLTDSYNIGGYISILSLNSLFILISKFNLNYPSFYPKLYALLQPHIFHMKYRVRFLQLLSLFLTSSYLPNYLITSFIKKLARLSLVISPACAIYCLAIIFNLLRRHPIARPLINRTAQEPKNIFATPVSADGSSTAAPATAAPAGGLLSRLAELMKQKQAEALEAERKKAAGDESDDEEYKQEKEVVSQALKLSIPVRASTGSLTGAAGYDPFLNEETDPSKTHAGDSSLWEIKALTSHISPTVANLAKVFFTTFAPKKELEMEKYLQMNYELMFNKELERRSNQQLPINHVQFKGIFADAQGSMGLTFQLPAFTIQDAAADE